MERVDVLEWTLSSHPSKIFLITSIPRGDYDVVDAIHLILDEDPCSSMCEKDLRSTEQVTGSVTDRAAHFLCMRGKRMIPHFHSPFFTMGLLVCTELNF